MIYLPHRRKAFQSTAYVANTAAFDGSTYLARGGGLTGAPSTSKVFTLSLWFNGYGSSDSATNWLLSQADDGFMISRFANNKILLECNNSSSVNLDTMQSSNQLLANSGWHHILYSFKADSTRFAKLYVDGIDRTSDTIGADGYIDFVSTNHYVGTNKYRNSHFVGKLAEIYINFSNQLDITDAAVRELFRISSTGKPANIPANIASSALPNPIIYLNKPYGTFHQNAGTGGDFSVAAGALTDGGTI